MICGTGVPPVIMRKVKRATIKLTRCHKPH
jgi:hypothetical protein